MLVAFFLLLSPALNNAVADEHGQSATQPSMFAQILDYARLSNAVYASKNAAARVSQQQGYTLTSYHELPDVGVTYFIATDDTNKKQIVAVRGTVNILNALSDVDIQLVDNSDIDAQLHRGFADAAKAIYQQLKPNLKSDYQQRITGHSLGGAIAMILGMYLDIDNYTVERVITFGQPKVTNIAGTQRFSHLDVWRVVTARDLVPLLPPLDVMDINNLDIYWPLGQEIILLDKTDYSVASGLDSMLRATKFLKQQLSEKNLQHHQMSYYLRAIERKQNAAHWVPYKNDFSMFSIFSDKQ